MAKKSAPAKYTDKTKGQPQLQPIFDKVQALVAAYEKGNYVAKANQPGHYELYYNKEVEVAGRKYPELSFASVLVQKGYVGFYFFPVYIGETVKSHIGSDLLKTLKGKTCFHIKNDDRSLIKQIREALHSGYKLYQQNGWR